MTRIGGGRLQRGGLASELSATRAPLVHACSTHGDRGSFWQQIGLLTPVSALLFAVCAALLPSALSRSQQRDGYREVLDYQLHAVQDLTDSPGSTCHVLFIDCRYWKTVQNVERHLMSRRLDASEGTAAHAA